MLERGKRFFFQLSCEGRVIGPLDELKCRMKMNWLARIVEMDGVSQPRRSKHSGPQGRRRNTCRWMRQHLRGIEMLEDRSMFAGFSLVGATLQINLASNEAIAISANSGSYAFALSTGTWTGSDVAGATGNGLATLTASAANATTVKIDDSGSGNTVTFANSGTNTFVSNFAVNLDDAAAGPIVFNGSSLFTGNASLTISTSKNVLVNSAASVSTVNGNLSLSANQQTLATPGTFVGLDINGGSVKTLGTGLLSLSARGGSTGNGNFGLRIRSGGTVESTGAGSVLLTGAVGNVADTSGVGIQVVDSVSTVKSQSGTGAITLVSDSIDIASSGSINAGNNAVTLRPRSNGVAIHLGGTDVLATPELGLTDAELDQITASSVTVGNSNSGPISISAVISPLNYKTLVLANNTTFGATSGFSADVGPTVATYEKISVVGTVSIAAGATFTLASTGGYVAATGDLLTLISNDQTDPISGTFVGPGLTNFLGSSLTASQSYSGGTGNDFEISVPNRAPTFTPGANITINEDSGGQTFANWATGISAGQGENSQTLTFTVNRITPPLTAAQTQWEGYAGGAQHQAISSVASQPLNSIRWQTPVDLTPQYSGTSLLIHYGTPLVTQSNTVIVPVKTGATNGFRIDARNGADGSLIWSQTTDYILPPHNWTPSYGPTLAIGNRIYYPGAGGTVYWRDAVDSPTPTATGQIAFFGLSNYAANPTAYNNSIAISTPLTSDSAGNIYFGYRTTGTNPLGITDGFARIAANGTATFTSALTASAGLLGHAVTNAAPAISGDGLHVYVAVSNGQGFGQGRLLRLNSQTLAPESSVVLNDVKSGSGAFLPDDGTASPMVGPDGDVYFGVLENPFPSNHDRGWMLHFSGDLSQSKTAGAFGWDDTASVVPSDMVPSYQGNSSYLLMTKYNNYAGVGGNGINKIAILDPNASMVDPITGATVMQEVLTIAGATPDSEFPSTPGAVREWCINTAVVDPATKSILVNSEDGKLYRWDLTTNSFTQVITLTLGVGEAYTPTFIGADGAVYAINNATLFSVGYGLNDLNSGLFSVPPAIDPTTGTLTFTPAPNAFGTAQITVSLKDSGGTLNGGVDTTTKTFMVHVQSVNDAPALTRVSSSVSGNVGLALTNSGTWSDVDSTHVTLSASVGSLIKNRNGTWTWSYLPTTAATNQTVTITGTDEQGGSSTVSFSLSAFSTFATRGLAYVGATGSSAATSLATDKVALLPGQSSTFANYTNYSLGLNGVVVDLNGLPAATTNAQMLASLQFAQWDGIAAEGFTSLPSIAIPSVTIANGGGTSGSSRVRIVFPDNSIQNTWLQVTVLANQNTGLSANDVFYFGNVVGDFDIGNTSTRYRVNALDTSAVRNNQSTGANSVGVTNIYDVNRDGRVNALDTSIVRNNQQTSGLVAPITAPSARNGSASRTGARTNSSIGNAVPLQFSLGVFTTIDGELAAPELTGAIASTSNSVLISTYSISSMGEAKGDEIGVPREADAPMPKKPRSADLESLDAYFSTLWYRL
jgi:Dockerin type I domain